MEDIRKNGRILSDSIGHATPKAVKGKLFCANSIIMATTATIGEHALITVDFLANQQFTILHLNDEYKHKILPKFAYFYCYILADLCRKNVNTSAFSAVNMTSFKNFMFPIIPLSIQRQIVDILDKLEKFVASLQEGLPAEIEARRKQYEYYREKLLTFEQAK
jgi:type I restriction enzyme S subunit